MEWIHQFGSAGPAEDFANAVDADGNVYVAGYTYGTLPGQTSAGGYDAFVRKYDADGNHVWTHQFGTSSFDYALGVSVDAIGVYVAGGTYGTLLGQTSAGGCDAFVRTYDADGNHVWTRQFGTSSIDLADGVSVDATGVYVAGRTYGILPGQTSAGSSDAFVRKYDADGNQVWTDQFGTLSGDYAFGVSVDATGVYVAGSTLGTLPGQTSAGGYDAFVRKYDADGNQVWTNQFGTSSSDLPDGVSVDATGVCVAGYTLGALPGQTSAGGYDAFVRTYDADGNEVWTDQFGTSSTDVVLGVYVDATGVYVAGYTLGALPGQTSAGGYDAFVRTYDADGNQVWTRQFGTSSSDYALGVSVDATGMYVAGTTYGTFEGQTSAGYGDAFVVKFTLPNTPPMADAGGPYQVDEGGSIALDGSVVDPDEGDTHTFAWDLDYDGVTFDVDTIGAYPIFDAANLDGPDSHTVALRVTDSHNASHIDTAEVTIHNVAPSVDSIGVPSTPVHIDEQASYSVDVAFTDPAGANDEPYTCDFDLNNDGVEDETVSGVTGTSCSATLNYATSGVYTVKVTVTDKDGGSGSETATEYVVVYDPEGGFVTGDGWFDSSEGAYAPAPDLTGKASFSFVSKYKKNANIPTGQTQFKFKAADLNFRSDTYQWLVVAGHQVKYKGTGTINGAGHYGFMISAIDEALTTSTDVDRFRIKIWDMDDGDVVVYDNQMDADDDADPTTAIGGGDIVIHKGKE
jgi:uncharacterized protein (UPF0548 family)